MVTDSCTCKALAIDWFALTPTCHDIVALPFGQWHLIVQRFCVSHTAGIRDSKQAVYLATMPDC